MHLSRLVGVLIGGALVVAALLACTPELPQATIAIRREGQIAQQDTALEFALAAVPGDLWGEVSVTSLRAWPVTKGALAVDWSALQEWVGEFAKTSARAEGVQASPPDAVFARVIPVAYRTRHEGRLAVAFLDLDTEMPLTLVYVDRPAKLSGTMNADVSAAGESARTLAVELDTAGFHWLALTQQGGLRVSHPSSVAVSVRAGASTPN